MERIPTIAQALAGVAISPSNNTINTFHAVQTQASSAQLKAGLMTRKTGSKSLGMSARLRKQSQAKLGGAEATLISPRSPDAISKNHDVYSMDLGTMGIPRSVAHGNQHANFLWTSNC
mmetsp:Transcript_16811/g.21273  ORF Transcript_16811/g.21273 Transcript_16811/m.21273 type:complete len:118 (+) Transcript_16811:756-1109(+)